MAFVATAGSVLACYARGEKTGLWPQSIEHKRHTLRMYSYKRAKRNWLLLRLATATLRYADYLEGKPSGLTFTGTAVRGTYCCGFRISFVPGRASGTRYDLARARTPCTGRAAADRYIYCCCVRVLRTHTRRASRRYRLAANNLSQRGAEGAEGERPGQDIYDSYEPIEFSSPRSHAPLEPKFRADVQRAIPRLPWLPNLTILTSNRL